MSSHRTLRHAVVAVSLMVAFLSQGTWALAGVTGNIAGTIKDQSGNPIAGVQVQAVAPSMTRTATTDAGGHFVILSLQPDTYTLNLSRDGYQSVSFPGVVVFADQTQQVAYTMQKALRTIAHVTSTAGASLVKQGVGADLYSVNSAQAAAAASLGGGGNLNNAYSAMASVPGVQTSMGGLGWDFNAAYIRGQNEYYTAYEYDGIPINRAFDNYNASTESSLGLQELQVYTGGGPSSITSAGTSGFINQVIKTGTFPGFATANLGIASPNFYHQAEVEIGGSTPDRTFSYYVGLLGYNQTYRVIDNSNGAGYMTPGGIYSGNVDGYAIGYGYGSDQVLINYTCLVASCQGVKPMCSLYGVPWSSPPGQGCWQYYSGTSADPAMISDREDVVNLHMGIPKANGLRDDVQLLWSGSALNNYAYQSLDDMGPGLNQFIYSFYNTIYKAPTCGPETIAPGLTVNGCSSLGQIIALQPFGGPFICNPAKDDFLGCAPTYYGYGDNVAYNLNFGTPIASYNYATKTSSITPPGVYMAPNTPAHDFDGPIPADAPGINVNQNDTGIVKLQYTYALSQSAYIRAYGYSFYSNWFENGPTYGATDGYTPSLTAADYELNAHTAGGAINFEDQINDQNLVTLAGNYTTSSVLRWNNYNGYEGCLGTCVGGSPIGYMSGPLSSPTCYAPTGTTQPCILNSYYDVATKSTVTPTWISSAEVGPTGFGAPAKTGATWDSLWQGNANGPLNTVRPRFTNGSLSDQWRPNDRFLINASIRYDNFTYVLPDSANAANQFYAAQTSNYTCVYAATNHVLTEPLPPGVPPPAPALYVLGDCDTAASTLFPAGPHTGWVHPNGTVQDGVLAPNFTASSPGSYTLDYWEPRFSGTWTVNPDNVIRASAGRFTQPPISASVQYLSASGNNLSLWNNMMNLGFYSPFHPIPGISSGQYDLSWESHLKGTDMSFKITPFYTWVTNWQQQTFIGSGFVTQVPVGNNRDEGVEFQFNKGDFTRNGLSGLVAVTYTNSKIQFQNVPLATGGVVTNQTTSLNAAIAQYNALTKGGGGAACYQQQTEGEEGIPVACTAAPVKCGGTPTAPIMCDAIANPYYNQAEQALLTPGAWYNPYALAVAPNLNGAIGSYISPWTSALILNWRHDKLAITPSFNFQTGGYYGSPLDTEGVDPRACVGNSLETGITKVSPKTNPLQCNYLTLTAPGYGTFGYLYIPNPQTGTFLFDNYEQPSQIVGNLQISYDVSPRIKLTILGANLFHECFGGTSAPWTTAFPPSYAICGYSPAGGSLNSSLYPSNFYNGTSINDYAANGAHTPSNFQQSYMPAGTNNGAIGAAVQPINVYFNAQVKI